MLHLFREAPVTNAVPCLLSSIFAVFLLLFYFPKLFHFPIAFQFFTNINKPYMPETSNKESAQTPRVIGAIKP